MSTQQLLLASGGDPGPLICDAADFDGVNDRATRGAGLSGAADSKQVTLAVWIKPDTLGAVARRIFSGVTALGGSVSGFVLDWHLTSANNLSIRARNATGTDILVCTSTTDPVTSAWNCFLFSCDLTDTGKRHLYLGDTNVASWATYTNDTIDFTLGDWGVGDSPAGSQKFDGGIAELYFKMGAYIDFSLAVNRRKFITSLGKPANLGSDGSAPGLGVPECYFHLDDGETANNFITVNRGGGGNFSMNTGGLTTYASSPSD